MKSTFLFANLLILSISFAQTSATSVNTGKLKFVELDYGLVKVVRGTQEVLKHTPTGVHGWLKDLVITKVTDSIKAEIKNSFGVVYRIAAKDTVDVNVDIEWVFPKIMTNDKGEEFKTIRYTTKRPTNIPSGSSYTFDEPFELLKGNWQMNVYLDNRKVYSRTFIVY